MSDSINIEALAELLARTPRLTAGHGAPVDYTRAAESLIERGVRVSGQPAEWREALTRSRIDHWLRNRNLMFHGIGFGPTVEAIMALIDDVLEPAPSGQWLEGIHKDRRVGA